MDPDPDAPEVDPEELSRYIADRTGIPVEVVARVLEDEMEYLIERASPRRSSDTNSVQLTPRRLARL